MIFTKQPAYHAISVWRASKREACLTAVSRSCEAGLIHLRTNLRFPYKILFLGLIMEKSLEADVVIIGGGMTGTTIARELSKYKVNTILLEQSGDLCAGQTKATLVVLYKGLIMLQSMMIKTVLAPHLPPYEPHTLKMKWSEEGFLKDWPQWLKELKVICMSEGEHGFLVIAVIGGGPAGISACLELSTKSNLKVGLFEKESELGGIPRFCHNILFGMRDLMRIMSGPKYARRLTSMLGKTAVAIYRESTVEKVVHGNNNELH